VKLCAAPAIENADEIFRVWTSFCDRVAGYSRTTPQERARVRAVQIVYYAGTHQRSRQTILLSSLRRHTSAGAAPGVPEAFAIVLGTEAAAFFEQATRGDNIFFSGSRGKARVLKLRAQIDATGRIERPVRAAPAKVQVVENEDDLEI
jgi:hypothetical protein